MDLKSAIFTFLLLLLLFSTGSSDVLDTSEMFEIDYRGPETHSSIPPPDHSHGKPLIHKGTAVTHSSSKGSRGGNKGGNPRKIHG